MTLDRIVLGVDANGGDWFGEHPSGRVIEAVSLFQKDYPDVDFVIFGNEEYLSEHIEIGTDYVARFKGKFSIDSSRVNIINAPYYFSSPRRTKKAPNDSEGNEVQSTSTVKMLESLNSGEIDCAVSMADTGSLLLQSVWKTGMIEGLEMKKPLLFQKIPTRIKNKQTLWGDLGSDNNPKADYVFEYALLLNLYAKKVLKWNNPTLKILANGTEKHKGSDFEKEVEKRIKAFNESMTENYYLRINLDEDYPYIESNQILYHGSDIVVSDGRVGNLVLKAIEGAINFSKDYFKEVLDFRYVISELKKNPKRIVDLILTIPVSLSYPLARSSQRYRKSKLLMDPQSYNGAPLLGLNNYVVKLHGNSTTIGIYNGLRNAMIYRKSEAIPLIEDAIKNIKNEL
ncbi:MAG: hypothetical protein ACP5N3_03605, partial [Candidatus Nanoarchaeia archaeon]